MICFRMILILFLCILMIPPNTNHFYINKYKSIYLLRHNTSNIYMLVMREIPHRVFIEIDYAPV